MNPLKKLFNRDDTPPAPIVFEDPEDLGYFVEPPIPQDLLIVAPESFWRGLEETVLQR